MWPEEGGKREERKARLPGCSRGRPAEGAARSRWGHRPASRASAGGRANPAPPPHRHPHNAGFVMRVGRHAPRLRAAGEGAAAGPASARPELRAQPDRTYRLSGPSLSRYRFTHLRRQPQHLAHGARISSAELQPVPTHTSQGPSSASDRSLNLDVYCTSVCLLSRAPQKSDGHPKSIGSSGRCCCPWRYVPPSQE